MVAMSWMLLSRMESDSAPNHNFRIESTEPVPDDSQFKGVGFDPLFQEAGMKLNQIAIQQMKVLEESGDRRLLK